MIKNLTILINNEGVSWNKKECNLHPENVWCSLCETILKGIVKINILLSDFQLRLLTFPFLLSPFKTLSFFLPRTPTACKLNRIFSKTSFRSVCVRRSTREDRKAVSFVVLLFFGDKKAKTKKQKKDFFLVGLKSEWI